MDSPDNLVLQANRTGFETKIYLGSNFTSRYIGAAALTTEGEILGSTAVIDMANGKPVMMPSRINSFNSTPSKTTYGGTVGMLGGAFMAFGTVSAMVHFLYRRRLRMPDPEKARYKRVDTDEEDRR